jgi:hypothetical protein
MGCLPPQFVSRFAVGWFVGSAGWAAFDSNIGVEVKYLWTDAGDWLDVTIAIDWR